MIGNMNYNLPWSINIFLYRIRFSLRAWTGLHENSYVGEFSPLSGRKQCTPKWEFLVRESAAVCTRARRSFICQ